MGPLLLFAFQGWSFPQKEKRALFCSLLDCCCWSFPKQKNKYFFVLFGIVVALQRYFCFCTRMMLLTLIYLKQQKKKKLSFWFLLRLNSFKRKVVVAACVENATTSCFCAPFKGKKRQHWKKPKLWRRICSSSRTLVKKKFGFPLSTQCVTQTSILPGMVGSGRKG